jgi:hypothetical protein
MTGWWLPKFEPNEIHRRILAPRLCIQIMAIIPYLTGRVRAQIIAALELQLGVMRVEMVQGM